MQLDALIGRMHEHKILHCDLHLSNIVVNRDGQFRIIDFGMSRMIESHLSARTIASIKKHYQKEWGIYRDLGDDPRMYDLACYHYHYKLVKRRMREAKEAKESEEDNEHKYIIIKQYVQDTDKTASL